MVLLVQVCDQSLRAIGVSLVVWRGMEGSLFFAFSCSCCYLSRVNRGRNENFRPRSHAGNHMIFALEAISFAVSIPFSIAYMADNTLSCLDGFGPGVLNCTLALDDSHIIFLWSTPFSVSRPHTPRHHTIFRWQ